ncbi:MAG: bifunctional hydroxymethylpyrimidine kinase/phosphomethylpyrimidine kinase [Gemmataceae bacterium]|nr:bifunctional hydroxymethylpyrimidine kinase/phosphomethylpyrimidine kinase [Gemmataceae bacterium]
MIVAAGLTPAWQQILSFRHFHPGEVNRAEAAHWCASGKAVNVATAIRHLGGDAILLSPRGGTVGTLLSEDCNRLGVAARWIDTTASARVCTTILDQTTGSTTELVENAAPLTSAELAAFIEATRQASRTADVMVLSGSLTSGAPATVYRDILDGYPGRAIVDARGDELQAALAHRPFLIKPNREELARTVGRTLADEAAVWQAMDEVRARGASWVVVSAGPGAMLIASPEGRYRLQPPPAPVVNPIGCGDCLAAGIAWSLSLGSTALEAIRHGIGAAADNLGRLLPARLNADRVRHFASQATIERVG